MAKIKSFNPLVDAMKTKNVFLRIPSNGVLEYDESIFTGTTKTELGVSGRTSKDELRFHVPDALMNGKAVAGCIESCIDEVVDANGLYLPDVYTMLMGIKLASGEKTYDIEATCPKCSKKGAFTREIEPLIEGATLLYEPVQVTLDNKIVIELVPNTWGFFNSINEKLFQQQYTLKVIQQGLQDKEVDEQDAAKQIEIICENLMRFKHDLLAEAIKKVTLPDGREFTAEQHSNEIREFVDCFNTEQVNIVKEKTNFLNNELGIDGTFPVCCSGCGHEWDITQLEYDPSLFFGHGFSTQPKKK